VDTSRTDDVSTEMDSVWQPQSRAGHKTDVDPVTPNVERYAPLDSSRSGSKVGRSAARPDVGRSIPAAHCKSVVLPDPDGPITAVNSARAKPALTASRAVTPRAPVP